MDKVKEIEDKIKMINHNTPVLPKSLPPLLLAGIFLISLSVLTLEITFTRVLSVILSYHYVFVVISMALLGLGGGGIIVYYIGRSKTKLGFGHLALWAGLFSLSIPISVIGIISIPFSANLLPYSLLTLVPFFFAGMLLSQVFQDFAFQSGKVYAADLLGAAAGALLAIPLLDRFGGINSALLVGLIAGAACLLFVIKGIKTRIWLSAVNLILIGTLFLTSLAVPDLLNLPVNKNLEKELANSLQDNGSGAGKIIESRWSSFGRTDLVQYPKSPDVMTIFTDATAGSGMYRFSGDVNNPGPVPEAMKGNFPGYFPLQYLATDQKDNALIIGPGGGRDVLLALMAGIGQITAVEVNEDVVSIVKKYSDYNGGIYMKSPNVNTVVAEGRSFLRQQKDRYDIIMLSLAVTKTSRSPEGFALTENFLFTRESMQDYLDHLTDEGRLIVVTHGPAEVMRLISISYDVLGERGVSDKMDYIYTVGSHMNTVFVLSKNKISPDESITRHRAVHNSAFDPRGSYFPYIRLTSNLNHLENGRFDECQMLDPALMAVAGGYISLDDLGRAAAENDLDISVVTDNRPFFYNFEKGVPDSLSSAFWFAIIFVMVSIVVPYVQLKKRRPAIRNGEDKGSGSISKLLGITFFFFMLGVGFMLAEIPLIQSFILFLGVPTLSVGVLLFSILVGAGLGGLTSSRITWNPLARKIGLICLGISILILLYAFAVPQILTQLLYLSLPLRVIVSAGLLIPLGFSLGFPFPLGIRLVKEKQIEGHVPWLWGINGTASVLGSVTAVVVAITLGLSQALLIGAACYLAASLTCMLSPEKSGYLSLNNRTGNLR